MHSRPKLVIIGGGIIGLSAAYIAAKDGYEVTILEAAPDVGGLLKTFEPVPSGDQLEHFYHHFFKNDVEFLWLLKELGIDDKLIFHDSTMGFYRKNALYPFSSAKDLLKFKPLSLFGKLAFILTSLYLGKSANWKNYENVSAYQWIKRYGGRNLLENIWGPMLNVKFGPYAKDVPLAWLIGRLTQRFSSRENGSEKLGYIDGSLNIVLEALKKKLSDLGVNIQTNSFVIDLVIENKKITKVKTNTNEFETDYVLATIPSNVFSKIIAKTLPEMSTKLEEIKYFGAVCTIITYPEKLSDYYWLNVADESLSFGGIIEHTNLIPPEKYNGRHITYLSKYFDLESKFAYLSNDEIKEIMLNDLKKVFPHFDKEKAFDIYVFSTKTAATVCDLGFSKKVPDCRTEIDGLYIANMAHIYPDERSCNNSIRVAAEACKLMGIKNVNVPYKSSLSAQIGMHDENTQK